jgi:hypothetical protein
VIVDCQGLRLTLEAEFGRNGQSKKKALQAARERVERAIAHLGIAVVYPAKLRNVPFARARVELANCNLEFAIVTEAAITQVETQLVLKKGRVANSCVKLNRSESGRENPACAGFFFAAILGCTKARRPAHIALPIWRNRSLMCKVNCLVNSNG